MDPDDIEFVPEEEADTRGLTYENETEWDEKPHSENQNKFAAKNSANPFLSARQIARKPISRHITCGNFSELGNENEYDPFRSEDAPSSEAVKDEASPQINEVISKLIQHSEYERESPEFLEIHSVDTVSEIGYEDDIDEIFSEFDLNLRQARDQAEFYSFDKSHGIIHNLVTLPQDDEDAILMFACDGDEKKLQKLKKASRKLISKVSPKNDHIENENQSQNHKESFNYIVNSIHDGAHIIEAHLTPYATIGYVMLFGYLSPFMTNMIVWLLVILLCKVMAKLIDHTLNKHNNRNMISTVKDFTTSIKDGKKMLLDRLLDVEPHIDIDSASMHSISSSSTSRTFVQTMLDYQRIEKPNYKIITDNALSVPVYSPRLHITCQLGGRINIEVKLLIDLGMSSQLHHNSKWSYTKSNL